MFDIAVYTFVALFIAWMWVDYFRLIDVFEKESLFRVGVTFFLGAASVLPVLGLGRIIENPFGLTMNGEIINDFLYCTFSIGLVEETSKALLFLIALLLFRKHINEPADYIATISVCALGFAAAENVLYFTRYGAHIISSRAILSTVGHMMFASVLGYGILLVKYRNRKPAFLILPLYLLIGSAFHGIYNFWLMYEGGGSGGWLLTVFFFMIGISFFASVLNNAMNISPFFSYKHVIHTTEVAKRMLLYYASLFGIQFLICWLQTDLQRTVALVISNALIILPITLISVVRLSRFKLIRDRWNKIRPELPFTLSFGGSSNFLGLSIGIKGDPYSDYHVNKFYKQHFSLCPVSRNSKFLKFCRPSCIFRKVYMNGDQSYYIAEIFVDVNQKKEFVILQIKKSGTTMMNGFPVVALFDAQEIGEIQTTSVPVEVSFIEWAVLRPKDDLPGGSAIQ